MINTALQNKALDAVWHIVLVLFFCAAPLVHAADPPRAEVRLGWIDLNEADHGWTINHVYELGDYNLPFLDGDLLTQIEGQDAATLAPISLVTFLDDAYLRKVKVVVERRGQPLQLEMFLAAGEELAPERYAIGVVLVPGPGGSGIAIAGTQRGGPAEKAGLQKDDMILAVDGKDVNALDPSGAYKLLTIDHPAPVKLRVLRGKTEFDVSLNRVSTRSLDAEMEAISSGFPIHKRGEPLRLLSPRNAVSRNVEQTVCRQTHDSWARHQ